MDLKEIILDICSSTYPLGKDRELIAKVTHKLDSSGNYIHSVGNSSTLFVVSLDDPSLNKTEYELIIKEEYITTKKGLGYFKNKLGFSIAKKLISDGIEGDYLFLRSSLSGLSSTLFNKRNKKKYDKVLILNTSIDYLPLEVNRRKILSKENHTKYKDIFLKNGLKLKDEYNHKEFNVALDFLNDSNECIIIPIIIDKVDTNLEKFNIDNMVIIYNSILEILTIKTIKTEDSYLIKYFKFCLNKFKSDLETKGIKEETINIPQVDINTKSNFTLNTKPQIEVPVVNTTLYLEKILNFK